MPEDEDTSRFGANRWIALPAAAIAVLLLIAGFYLALAPSLQFHTADPNAYVEYRNAAPFLLAASIVPANVWAWSVIGPRINPARPYWAVRLVGAIPGTLVASALAAGILFYALIVIALATTDWFTF